jgi:hypothetical protein
MPVEIREGVDRLVVTGADYAAVVDLASLQLYVRSGTMQYNFSLSGCVRVRRATEAADNPIADGMCHTARCTVEGNTTIITATTKEVGLKRIILLEFSSDHFTYALGMEPNDSLLIYDVNYGMSLDADGAEKTSQAEFEEFFIWCPDRYQSIVPFNQEVELRLSSVRLPEEGFFRGDAGKYLVPPYIAALRSGDQWTGLATLEIPGSQMGLDVFVTRHDYRLNFRYSHNLAVGPGKVQYFPKVGFFFSDHRNGILGRYVDYLYENKIAAKPSTWASWWSGPMYCTYADQVYQHTIDSGIMKDEPGASANCTEEFVTERLRILDDHRIPYNIITLDYAWLGKLGDHLPHPGRFPDLRAFVDRLHQQGKHVLLWFAPFFCEAESALALEHRDWMIKTPDGSPHSHTWMQKTVFTPDFTRLEVRAYFTSLVRKLLGSASGEFNADGFKIDGYSFLPDVGSLLFDPSWGTGELFQYKADKLIYDAAKSVKADSLVEQSFANPLFNDVQDVCRLDDASNYDTDLYENRAWVALLSQVAVPDTDDWSAFKKTFIHSTLRKAVYGIPTLYAIKYRGTGRMGGASGGYPVPITRDDYSRVSAILRVYQHAPVDYSQERFVDPDNKIFWRKHTAGRLAGFYAATTLAGNTAIATFTPEAIYLAAIVETQPVVPLPPGSKVKRVKEIHVDGRIIEPRHEVLDEYAVIWMLPSIGDVDHYEIELARI